MQQLVFELAAPEPPRLSNFLPGRNGELLALLPGFVAGSLGETSLFVWGEAGSGKSHLLAAAQAEAQAGGAACARFATPAALDAAVVGAGPDVAIVDRIDEADERATGVLFTLYNTLKERGGRLLAASRTPLFALRMREDLRTRLGWGLVYEARPLADDDKGEAMALYAQQRGFELGADVIDYLLRHGRRDMPSLLRTLTALDRYSLAAKRPITVPLIRGWLQKELDWNVGSDHSA